jgi:hypothetical protein
MMPSLVSPHHPSDSQSFPKEFSTLAYSDFRTSSSFAERDDSNLLVLAVAHTSQHSGYWSDRA